VKAAVEREGFGTVTARGLSSAEAARRLTRDGPNRLVPRVRFARARALAQTLADPMAIMLAVTGTLYLVLGELRDGIAVLIALGPVLAVDVVLEARSRSALAALAAAVAPRARVLRDGVETSVASEALVAGDALLVHEGDLVLADARVLDSANLTADESSLTGESEPQDKPVGASIFAGARVIAGSGLAEVVAIGVATSYGKVAALVAGAGGKTPLERRVGSLVRRFGAAALGLAALVLVLGVVRGQGAEASFIGAVSLGMAAIPEEFPLVLTLFLSLGAWRLSRHRVLVRRLSCVEALGSTTVLCVDKTGTLTKGRFVLDRHVGFGGDDELLTAAALACEPALDDPMDHAIADHCTEHGLEVAALHQRWRLVFDHPFEPAGRHVTHVWTSDGQWRVAMKGGVEGVLEHCAIDGAGRAAVERAVAELAGAGMRVLAVASRDRDQAVPADRRGAEDALILRGLLGFRDPLRAEARAAITACRAAGIAVKMVTGDHPVTARAIAEEAGLAVGPGAVLTGVELAALPAEARGEAIARAAVLARIRPEDKHAIVDALERRGEVVAMTGDGVNDAAALRRASVGVSMGARASEVARAAAGLILLDDDLGALVATIAEGRRIRGNLQRAFLFLIGFHVPVIALAVIAPLAGLPLVLLPLHLVWLELVVHPVSALVFEGEPAPPDTMTRPPPRRDEPLLGRAAMARSLVSGALIAGAALALFVGFLGRGEAMARTAALIAVITGGVMLAWAERALDRAWWRVPAPGTRRVWVVLLLAAGSLPVAIAVPALARALHLTWPGSSSVALAVAAGVAAVAWRVPGARSPRATTAPGGPAPP